MSTHNGKRHHLKNHHERRTSLRISHIESIVHSKLDQIHKGPRSPHPAHEHHSAGATHREKHRE